MRRILLFLLVVTGSLLISSCLTIEERVKLNADGSGVQVSTIDFSELLQNPLIRSGMEQEMAKGDGEIPQRIDSSFSVYEQMLPLNPQWTAEERALLARSTATMTMDFIEGIGEVVTRFEFNDPAEIAQLADLMANSNKPEEGEDGGGNPFANMSGQSFVLSTFNLKGKKLIRTTTTSPDFENPMAEAGLEDGMMDMMKEMFGDAVMTYVIEFPGKVKKVSGFPGHEIDGNELIMAVDFNEMLENPEAVAKVLTGEVKFKK